MKRKTATKRLRAKLQEVKQDAAAAASRADPGARQVAAQRGAGVLQLPRSPRQHGGSGVVPDGDARELAAARCGDVASGTG